MTDFDKHIERRGTCSMKYDSASAMKKPEGLLPLWVADMDFQVPACVTKALKERADHAVYGYSFPGDSYYEAVTNWFESRFDYKIDRKWIVTTPGVVFALCQAVNAFTRPGDAVLVTKPVYYPFMSAIENNGRRVVNSPLVNEDGYYTIDFGDFEQKIIGNDVKMFILCSPHNPVGRVWKEEELDNAAQICAKHGVFVVSDEIHCDFVWGNGRHVPFAKAAEKTDGLHYIICTAPSKTFNLAGLQCSNIIVPDDEDRRKYRRTISANGVFDPNIMGLTACQAAYAGGAEWLGELRSHIWKNIEFADSFINDKIPGVKMRKPEGTYLIWLDMRGLGLSAGELDDFITDKAGLWLDGGSMFGEEGDGFQRINTACQTETLRQALTQLKNAAETLTGGSK
ncbi:MAG: MalY/PatB family protein [Anaerovoracaceae bacterium]